jgi:RimJ/RimL family protein N-acetyltransferase
MMPAVPFPDPPLGDGVVVLRPLSPEDAGEITSACQDPEISRWTSVPPVYREGDGRDFIATVERDREAGRGVTLAVVMDAGTRFAGSIALHCDWEHRKGEVSYWIAPDARHRSAGTRAVGLVAHWAFVALGLERLELLSNPENEPSRRLALRAGFTSEGLLRAYRPRNGNREDFLMFSLLPTDPPT